jgi:hypothetical protein
MATSINDIINQSLQNTQNVQQANAQLQNLLNQINTGTSSNSNITLPSDLILSPQQVEWYNTLMTEDPTSSIHKHGKTVATFLSDKVPAQIQQMENPSNYPLLTNLLQDWYNKGMQALPEYTNKQKDIASSAFANTWQSPNEDINPQAFSLAGNVKQNAIMSQYQQQYGQHEQELEQKRQQFLQNVDNITNQMKSSLEQLKNPDTAKAIIMGLTATYLQNVLNRISPYLTPDAYQKSVKGLQDTYINDVNFLNSYNKLFNNYLNLNINILDQLKGLQPQAINQTLQEAKRQANTLFGQIPDYTPISSQYSENYLLPGEQDIIDYINQVKTGLQNFTNNIPTDFQGQNMNSLSNLFKEINNIRDYTIPDLYNKERNLDMEYSNKGA